MGHRAMIEKVMSRVRRLQGCYEGLLRKGAPRMFAAVFLISAAGVLIFALLTGLSRLALGRWHESEIEAEG